MDVVYFGGLHTEAGLIIRQPTPPSGFRLAVRTREL